MFYNIHYTGILCKFPRVNKLIKIKYILVCVCIHEKRKSKLNAMLSSYSLKNIFILFVFRFRLCIII